MLRCEHCGRNTPVLKRMYVLRKDNSVSVCDKCAKKLEEQNLLWAKVQLTCCMGVAFAAVMIILALCLIIFNSPEA